MCYLNMFSITLSYDLLLMIYLAFRIWIILQASLTMWQLLQAWEQHHHLILQANRLRDLMVQTSSSTISHKSFQIKSLPRLSGHLAKSSLLKFSLTNRPTFPNALVGLITALNYFEKNRLGIWNTFISNLNAICLCNDKVFLTMKQVYW